MGSGLTVAAQQAWKHPRLTLGMAAAVFVIALTIKLWSGGASTISSPIAATEEFFEQLFQHSPLDQLDPARITGLSPEQRLEGTVAVMTGHRLAENFLKFSPDGRFLAVCGDTSHRELALYDLAGPEPKLYQLTGHKGYLYLAAFSPNSKLLVSVSVDNTARQWGLERLPPRFLRENPCSRVNSLAFSPTEDFSAVATNQEIHLWRNGYEYISPYAKLEAMTDPVAFTAQGHLLACSAPIRNQIHLMALEQPKPVEKAVIPLRAPLTTFALALNANQLVTGDNVSGVDIWNLNQTPPVSKTLAMQSQQESWTTAINALAITRDGKAAAAGTMYGFLRIWDLSGSEPRRRAQLPPVKDGSGVARLFFSPNGKWLIELAANSVRVWDVATGQKFRQWHFPTVNTIDLAPDGRHIAVGSGNNLFILRLAGSQAASR